MRIFERLQILTSFCLLTCELLKIGSSKIQLLHLILFIQVLAGFHIEGIRITQIPLATCLFLHSVLLLGFGIKIGYVLYIAGLAFSCFCWYKFGLGDYSKYKPSGSFRVGCTQFTTIEYKNQCAVYYPAADDKSG